jgi:hypothetical protein
MQTNSPSDAQDFHQLVDDHRPGNRKAALLLNGREGTPANYRLALSEGGSADWTAPRHRHIFEQFRYILSGDYVIGKDDVLPAGWAAYFPQSVYYGPQIKKTNMTMIILQFGGPSGLGYWSPEQFATASNRLEAKGNGTFDTGIYSWVDADGQRHNQDAVEAVEEEFRGHKIEYPPAQYKDVVRMNPQSFSWVNDSENPGVARKKLGAFTERDVRFGLVRVEKGATLPFGTEKSPEALVLMDGMIAHDNRSYDRYAAFGTEPEESPVELTAVEPSELLYMKLPTY